MILVHVNTPNIGQQQSNLICEVYLFETTTKSRMHPKLGLERAHVIPDEAVPDIKKVIVLNHNGIETPDNKLSSPALPIKLIIRINESMRIK